MGYPADPTDMKWENQEGTGQFFQRHKLQNRLKKNYVTRINRT